MSTHPILAALRAGEPVVIPTDTVYGVAVDPSIEGATERLFALKGRPPDKALPVLGASIESLRLVAQFDRRAESLAERFWPGALTLVLPRADGFEWPLGGKGDATVGVRIPDHAVALELLESYGPLAVTSANRSGEPPATTADETRRAFENRVQVLDGGPCTGGAASTVLSLVGEPHILRAGALTPAELGL